MELFRQRAKGGGRGSPLELLLILFVPGVLLGTIGGRHVARPCGRESLGVGVVELEVVGRVKVAGDLLGEQTACGAGRSKVGAAIGTLGPTGGT